MPEDDWFILAETALREAYGDEMLGALQAGADALPPLPVVSVFGAYDAGKSTLLKRLLVDAGVEPPSWLTISARRETFEVNEVNAFGCVLRDTPGVAAGSAPHESLALEAVIGSDVVMLVMPPQLLTGDRDLTLSLLSGEAFRPGGLALANSLLIVIAKLDEGMDPVEDLAAYSDYVARKRREWKTLLENSATLVAAAPVFAVSADPFQRVGSEFAPAPEDYDEEFRVWDGIAELVDALVALPARLPTLRRAARARQICRELGIAVQTTSGRLDELAVGRDEAEQAKRRLTNFERKLEGLLNLAKNELERALSDAVLTITRRRNATPKDALAQLEAFILRWEESQNSALDKLITESEAELEARERVRRAAASAEDVDRDQSSTRARPSLKGIKDAFPHAEKMFDQYAKYTFDGDTLSGRCKALQKLQAERSTLVAKNNAEKIKTIDNKIADLENSIGYLPKIKFAIDMLPHILSAGELIYGEIKNTLDAADNEKKRAQAREQIQVFRDEMKSSAWGPFSTQAGGFSAWIKTSVANVDEVLRSLDDEETRLRALQRGLQSALDHEPIPCG